MKKLLVLFVFFSTFAFADMSNQELIGDWKVTKWITTLDVGNLSQADIDSIPGKILTIDTQTISLQTSVLDPDDRSCAIDNVDSGWVNRDPYDYFVTDNDYLLEPQDVENMNLQAPFWTLASDCIQVFTQKNPNSIIFMFGSGFFEAKRISNS